MKRIRIASIKRFAQIRPEGYEEEHVSAGTIDGDFVLIEDDAYNELVKKYRKPPEATYGAGTELKALLAKVGIRATDTCPCNAKAMEMNAKGIEWCQQNVETICDWLQEEATKRKLPFLRAAGKALIYMAIRRAKKNNSK